MVINNKVMYYAVSKRDLSDLLKGKIQFKNLPSDAMIVHARVDTFHDAISFLIQSDEHAELSTGSEIPIKWPVLLKPEEG